MRIVHLVSSLDPNATARYLSLVLPEVAKLGHELFAINCGASAPFADVLQSSGIKLETRRFRGPFDLAAAMRLRKAVASFAPDAIHVWGNAAAAIANVLPSCKVVVGDLREAHATTRILVGRTRRRARMVHDSKPVVDRAPVAPADLGLPAGARIVLNAGGFDERSDQRSAVWAFDMLRYADPTAHLVIAGDGPNRSAVRRFADSLTAGDRRVHFLGMRSDVPALLAAASVAFVLHRKGGTAFASEALAAGIPVVAVDTPEIGRLVQSGTNGLLANVGDFPGLARSLNRILSDGALAETLRAGARRTAVPGPEEAAAELSAIYRE